LLQQIEPRQGARDGKREVGAVPPLTRTQAADDAGMSEHQRKTAGMPRKQSPATGFFIVRRLHRRIVVMTTLGQDTKIMRDIVVIGASAGGLEALKILLYGLPTTLPAALFVVVHTTEHKPNSLRDVLARHCSIPVAFAEDNEAILLGRVLLSVPGKHLVLAADRVHLTDGLRENHSRPAIDVLFRTAAAAFGSRVIGIVLSGYLNDGTLGLQEIKAQGGVTIVQSPEEASCTSMPLSAIRNVEVDAVLSTAGISERITTLIAPVEIK
jgi:two-component system chemotaxis response regulator CheB